MIQKAFKDAECFDLQEIREVGTFDHKHGRIETRTLRALSVKPEPFAIEFPHVHQIAELTRERYVISTEKKSLEVVYLITNKTRDELSAEQFLTLKRKHWQIENCLNYVKDNTFGEDRSTARAKNGARVLSTLRNLALSIYRLCGVSNIKRAVDCIKRHPLHALQLIGALS